jgi:hypothetical protein
MSNTLVDIFSFELVNSGWSSYSWWIMLEMPRLCLPLGIIDSLETECFKTCSKIPTWKSEPSISFTFTANSFVKWSWILLLCLPKSSTWVYKDYDIPRVLTSIEEGSSKSSARTYKPYITCWQTKLDN